MLVGTRYQAALTEKRACDYFERSKAGIKAVFNVTAMERSILAELFERGGRGQLSGLRDRRPIERLVNKGFVERHTLKSSRQQVDKDRRTAEQRDELAPSYVERGASPPTSGPPRQQ